MNMYQHRCRIGSIYLSVHLAETTGVGIATNAVCIQDFWAKKHMIQHIKTNNTIDIDKQLLQTVTVSMVTKNN